VQARLGPNSLRQLDTVKSRHFNVADEHIAAALQEDCERFHAVTC
jgi:hypothetical protein